MSIINQVLKDLDRQRGPNDGLEVAALQGVGLVRGSHTVNWPVIALATGVLASLALGYQQMLSDTPTGAYRGAPSLVAEVDDIQPTHQPVVEPQATSVVTPAEIAATDSAPQPFPAVPEQSTQPVTEVLIEEPPVAQEQARQEPVVKTLSTRQQADHAFALAQRALENQDGAGAEQRFQDALRLNPQHSAARLQLAGIYLQRDQQARAADLLEDGLALNGTDPQLVHPYAQLLASRGQLIEALHWLAPLTDAGSLALSAAIHARLDRHARAATLYTRALKQDASRGNWWLGLGLSLEQQGQTTGARKAYRRAGDLPLADNVRAFVTKRIHSLDKLTGGN